MDADWNCSDRISFGYRLNEQLLCLILPSSDASPSSTSPWTALYTRHVPLLEWTTMPVALASFMQYRYASARSSGCPTFPVGILLSRSAKKDFLPSSPMPCHRSVSMTPGATQLTRM